MSKRIKLPKFKDVFPPINLKEYSFKQHKSWLRLYGKNEEDGFKICELTNAKFKPKGRNQKVCNEYFAIIIDEVTGVEYILKDCKPIYFQNILKIEHFTYEKWPKIKFKDVQYNKWLTIREYEYPEYKVGKRCLICKRIFQPRSNNDVICGMDNLIFTDSNNKSNCVNSHSKHIMRAWNNRDKEYISHTTFCSELCKKWNDIESKTPEEYNKWLKS